MQHNTPYQRNREHTAFPYQQSSFSSPEQLAEINKILIQLQKFAAIRKEEVRLAFFLIFLGIAGLIGIGMTLALKEKKIENHFPHTIFKQAQQSIG